MTIRVRLVDPSSRRFFLCRWKDPVTGRIKTRSTETTVRREAERFAGRLEDELNAGLYKSPKKTTWVEGREKFTRSRRSKAKKTQQKTTSMFNAVERLVSPQLIQSMTASVISGFSNALYDERLKPATIRGHLAEIRKFLRWAHRMDMIREVPFIDFPEVVDTMKGRPITAEEFDRFIAAIPLTDKVHPPFAESWKHFSEGLWLSGLRLEESMQLHWTDDRKLCIDLGHKHPMMRIQAEAEKGRTFRLLPITPDFAEFLRRTPDAKRRGYVFNPFTLPRGHQKRSKKETVAHRPTADHAGKVLCAVGKRAGIRVAESKFASAHDLRRAFGFRWARLVMPKTLQELMRHEDIKTTMKFYVGAMAEESAEAVWKAAALAGNTFGNTPPQHGQPRLPDGSGSC